MLELPALPYAYDALEPYIDEETMKCIMTNIIKLILINLNKLGSFAELKDLTAEQVLWRLNELKGKISDPVGWLKKIMVGGFIHHNNFLGN
jgi:Fe-Mn family superoxide dismutase